MSVIGLIRKLFILLFGARESQLEAEPPAPKQKPKRQSIGSFKRSVLSKLDQYFLYLRRLKQYHKDAYELHSRVGAFIVSKANEEALFERTLSPWFLKTRPSFGATMISDDMLDEEEAKKPEKDQLIPARFVYFTKFISPPKDVQPFRGDIYVVHAYWDDNKKFRATDCGYPILIDRQGKARALKTRFQVRLPFGASRMEWGYPSLYQFEFNRAKKDGRVGQGETLEQWMVTMFALTAGAVETANYSMIQITAKKGGIAARFCVDVTDTPRFFRDREKVIDARGRTARIFHSVMPHQRITSADKQVNVRMHFRGLRKFTWNGYEVAITVPVRDHLSFEEFNVGGHDPDSEFGQSLNEKVVDGRGLGQKLAKIKAAGTGAMRRTRMNSSDNLPITKN